MMRYAVLCQCPFQGTGALHPFVETMWALALSIRNIAPFVSERYQGLAHHHNVALTYHARIIRAIQLAVHDYLQQVATNVGEGVKYYLHQKVVYCEVTIIC